MVASSVIAESRAVSKSLRRDCPASKDGLETAGIFDVVSLKRGVGVSSVISLVCVPIDLSGSSEIAANERGRALRVGRSRLNVSRVVEEKVRPLMDNLLLRLGMSTSDCAGKPPKASKKDGTPSPVS